MCFYLFENKDNQKSVKVSGKPKVAKIQIKKPSESPASLTSWEL